MTLFLCGFMGCGKTALGKALAKRLELPLVDMDDLIVKREGMTIPEIFDQKGEPYFRKVESRLVDELAHTPQIVSCGGGVMTNPLNALIVRQSNGIIVYLQQKFAVCYERIKDDPNRPIVQSHTQEELQRIFENRERWNQVNATYSVLAGETPEESADRVMRILKKWSPQFLPKEEV